MSTTKHKIFKIAISPNGEFDFDAEAEKAINLFLADSNCVYVNHSITVLSEDIGRHDTNLVVNKFLAVSLVYKDLQDTQLDVSKVSKKTKGVVKKQVEEGVEITEPTMLTGFEKEVKELPNPTNPSPSHILDTTLTITIPKF